VVLVNKQESGCTHMSQMIVIMSDLKQFIAMYQEYSTRLNIHTLLDSHSPSLILFEVFTDRMSMSTQIARAPVYDSAAISSRRRPNT
jgi:hypothetical protein